VKVVPPVPPNGTVTAVPFQTPLEIVPTVDSDASAVTVVVTIVPAVGNVMFVGAVTVMTVANAPENVNDPASETALPPIDATVVASDAPGLVTSPVSAGNCAAKIVPVNCPAGRAVRFAPDSDEKNVPVNVNCGFTLEAAVRRPLLSTVNVACCVADPYVLGVTVVFASVVASDPPGVVTSPVRMGKFAAGN
jgi:hypothetical protein